MTDIELSEETKKALIGKTITKVGNDYIEIEGKNNIYLNEAEILFLNEINVG